MRSRRSMRAGVVVAGLLLLAACSTSTPPSGGSSGASPGSSTRPPGSTLTADGAGTVAWVAGAAEAADGPPPAYTAASTCGSSTATYLAELADTSPTDAKVAREWADVVPGGKQILVTGTLTSSHLGP